MPKIDFERAYASATAAYGHEKGCTLEGSAVILFDAARVDGKSLKKWCKASGGKCRSEEPKFASSSTGIVELLFPGGGHDEGCLFKKEAAHQAFGKSVNRQGSKLDIEYSSVF
jgi:hypothetical protein